jgi:group I intron endonuclease
MIIYKIINSINDKVYIGISSKDTKTRFDWHIRDCKRGVRKKLYSAMRELGIDNFSIILLEECNDKNLMREKEEFYISYFDAYNSGYNASSKSGGVKNHSLETKKKMSEIATGRIVSAETKSKKSDSMKKYWNSLSDDRKKELAKKVEGRYKGIKRSDEFRKKCAERMTGTTRSDETKQKMSMSRKGRILAKKIDLVCPHCDTAGKGNAMMRWHFDNCKRKS